MENRKRVNLLDHPEEDDPKSEMYLFKEFAKPIFNDKERAANLQKGECHMVLECYVSSEKEYEDRVEEAFHVSFGCIGNLNGRQREEILSIFVKSLEIPPEMLFVLSMKMGLTEAFGIPDRPLQ